MRFTIAIVFVFVPSLVAAQGQCGGHFVEYLGGPPRARSIPPLRQHSQPSIPIPGGATQDDARLWEQLVFDAYDHPTASPDTEDHWYSALPLDERHTRTMTYRSATSFNLCIQSPDTSYCVASAQCGPRRVVK